MTIRHPIADDLLMGYAAGHLPAAQDLLVATAVSLDDDARARLATFETVGGVLLDEGAPAGTAEDALAAVLERIDAAAPAETVPADVKTGRRAFVLPQPLREAVGGDLEAVRWSPLGMGARQCVVDLPADARGVARLLSIPAGQAMPDHGHRGVEYTLVLQGAFIDGDDRFARGDLEVADEMDEHMPVADIGAECICLVVTDAPLRFNAVLPRLAQRFLKI